MQAQRTLRGRCAGRRERNQTCEFDLQKPRRYAGTKTWSSLDLQAPCQKQTSGEWLEKAKTIYNCAHQRRERWMMFVAGQVGMSGWLDACREFCVAMKMYLFTIFFEKKIGIRKRGAALPVGKQTHMPLNEPSRYVRSYNCGKVHVSQALAATAALACEQEWLYAKLYSQKNLSRFQ
jgi:hypothetical protein